MRESRKVNKYSIIKTSLMFKSQRLVKLENWYQNKSTLPPQAKNSKYFDQKSTALNLIS